MFERRRHPRQKLNAAAIVHMPSSSAAPHVLSAVVTDISMGGVLLRVDLARSTNCTMVENTELEAFFRVDGDNFVASIGCNVRRCVEKKGELHIGACFTRVDPLTSAYLCQRLERRTGT